jgi:hypothetical protein
LSKGDIISIGKIYLLLLVVKCLSDYIGREFEVQIVETKPEDAVNIIECDMNVDFEAPVGYKGTNYSLGNLSAKNRLRDRGFDSES